MIRCKACGRFVKVTKVIVNGLEDIVSVVAECSRCGTIEDDDVIWTDYDELVSEDDTEYDISSGAIIDLGELSEDEIERLKSLRSHQSYTTNYNFPALPMDVQ